MTFFSYRRCLALVLVGATALVGSSAAFARNQDRYLERHPDAPRALRLAAPQAIPAVPYGGNNESLSDYPDLVQQWFDAKTEGVTFFTPAFTSNHGSFEQGGVSWGTTQEEMISFLNALPKDYLTMRIIGEVATRDNKGVVEGSFKVPLLVFSKPAAFDPADLHAKKKPIVYIQAMIHGNETSGCEAVLRLASQLARDDLKVLDKISVVLLPRYNVDGAWKYQRGTDTISPVRVNMDQNRDHTAFESPLTRLMHTVANQYQPHVALDLHEMNYDHTADYRVSGGDFVRFRDYHYFDLTTLVAHLYNVPAGITTLAREMEAQISADLTARGLAWNFYFYPWDMTQERAEIQIGGLPVAVSRDVITEIMEGPPDEAMGDSVLSLIPSIGMLFETRSPRVLVNYKPRVYAHATALESVINQTASRADTIRNTVESGRAAMANLGKSVSPTNTITLWIRQGQVSHLSFPVLRMSDDNSAVYRALYTVDKAYRNNSLTSIKSVVRPFAYLISTDQDPDAVAERLAYTGAVIERLTEATTLPAEIYTIDATGTDAGDRGSDYFPMRGLSHVITAVSTSTANRTFPKGTYVVYMDQASATHAALALEPMGNRNYGNYWLSRRAENLNGWGGFIPAELGREYPVYRYMTAKKLATAPVYLQRPFVEGARVQRCLPLDRTQRGEIEKKIGKRVAFGFYFSVEGATDPFTLIVPKKYRTTSLGSWYVYNWATEKFVSLKYDGTTVRTLPISNAYVSSTGEVLAVALQGDSEEDSGGCAVGGVASGMGSILLVTPLLLLWVRKRF